jgi:secreted Zn-dependent insulinase-like peptidase
LEATKENKSNVLDNTKEFFKSAYLMTKQNLAEKSDKDFEGIQSAMANKIEPTMFAEEAPTLILCDASGNSEGAT